jgi:hypothetical protein
MPSSKQSAPLMHGGGSLNVECCSIAVYMEARSGIDVIVSTLEFCLLVLLFVGLWWNYTVSKRFRSSLGYTMIAT